MVASELVDSAEGLEPHRGQWDELAESLGRPFCSPGWLLPWWTHLAPRGSSLRVALAREGGRLVGIAPCFLQARRIGPPEYRLLGGGSAHRIGPLAAGDRVLPALLTTLAEDCPRAGAMRLEGVDLRSGSATVARAWPGARGTAVRTEAVLQAPTVTLAGLSYERWLAAKSGNFRRGLRRMRRRLEGRGASFHVGDDSSHLAHDLAAFQRLHRDRWAGRGGSAVRPGTERLLRDAASELQPRGRLRLCSIWVRDRPICVQVFVAAGGRLAYWNGGFDESWARYSPGLVTMLAAVEDSFRRGEQSLDLGGGADPYKARFADRSEPVEWATVYPRGRRYPVARAQALPRQARRAAVDLARRVLPRETRWRVKRLVGGPQSR